MADQHEKAFQKQDAIFIGAKRVVKGSKKQGKLQRYWRNVGLSFQTPKVFFVLYCAWWFFESVGNPLFIFLLSH